MGEANEFKKTTWEIIKKVGCEYKVFTENNTAEEVEEAYFKALEEGKREGYLPVKNPWEVVAWLPVGGWN